MDKIQAKRKQFFSVYLPSIIVKTPTLAKARLEDKKFIEDFDDIINSTMEECAVIAENSFIQSAGSQEKGERMLIQRSGMVVRDSYNKATKYIAKAIRDSK